MRINKLSLTGIRALKHAELKFQPGMNILVGVNGVGKTTIMDALCVSFSRILPEITSSRSSKQSFENEDITIGLNTLQVSSKFEIDNREFELLLVKQKESTIEKDSTNIRDSVIVSSDKEVFTPTLKDTNLNYKRSKTQPLCIYFSTRRSIYIDQKTSPTSTYGGQTAAFAESLSGNRDFNLRIIAQWYKVQEEIGVEKPIAQKHISVLKDAVEKFLPEFSNLHIVEVNNTLQLRIEKNGNSFDLKQLSDGERGVLSMVLDIARRLSQANPELADPLSDGKAIILIDELDLHLHPRWQRLVVENLTRTFPNCQFIASTHSPQIIPSVEPEQVILLKGGDIIYPSRTKGMDSNWILKFLMDSEDRPAVATKAIDKVETLINQGDFDEAKNEIIKYKDIGLDLPEWSEFEAQIARFNIIGEAE